MTFSYVHDDTPGFSGFVHHLETYLPLFRQLSEFRMLYVSRTDAHFARATDIFDSLVKIPLESDIAEDLLRYFRVRKMWERKAICGGERCGADLPQRGTQPLSWQNV